MSSEKFESLVKKHPQLEKQLKAIAEKISDTPLNGYVDPSWIADKMAEDINEIDGLFQVLSKQEILKKTETAICLECETVLGRERKSVYFCDICEKRFNEREVCFLDHYKVISPIIRNEKNKEEISKMEMRLKRNKISPWHKLPKEEFFYETEQLHGNEIDEIKKRVQKYGLCWLRLNNAQADESILFSIQRMLGPTSKKQNDFEGNIKLIKPMKDGLKNSGDTRDSLGFHVDGTQHERQPAILIFQFISGANYGATSLFVDMAQVLLDIPEADRERIVLSLAGSGVSHFKKRGLELQAPNFKFVRDNSVAFRWGADEVMAIDDMHKQDAENLKKRIEDSRYHHAFLPSEGDVIIFDNWRLLHARDEVHGPRIRQHYRMWIEDIESIYQSDMLLGIRIFEPKEIAAIEAKNKR